MAKCKRCGKHGFFLKVNSEGICQDCLRLADIERQVGEAESKLSTLNEQLSDQQKLYDEISDKAKSDALKQVESELAQKQEMIAQKDTQIDVQSSTLNTLREEIEKGEKMLRQQLIELQS